MTTESPADTSPATPDAPRDARPWRWVPSLYFSEGVPYAVVMLVSVVMYKRLGVSNTDIAAYTSLLYLPWLIKPLWSPLVQRFSTRRRWIIAMQIALACGLAGTAALIPTENFLLATIGLLAITAIASATQDVAADGFYMLALDSHQQAWFVGVRSTFYRLAFIIGQGGLVMLAGLLESQSGPVPLKIDVNVVDGPAATAEFDPQTFPAATPTGEQVLLAQQTNVSLSSEDRTPEAVTDLVEQVRQWNVAQGFYEGPEEASSSDSDGDDGSEDADAPALPRPRKNQIESWVRWLFAAEEQVVDLDEKAGDAAVVMLRVSEPLEGDEQLAVQFGRSGGDGSIRLIEGERFAVGPANWQQPMAAVIQVEAKVDRPTQATFEARAGDVPLAWSTTFYGVAGLFAVLALYHTLAIPRPPADMPGHAVDQASVAELLEPFVSFFRKPGILTILGFLLLYRFAEAQLAKMAAPFLLDPRETGGLALTTGEFGLIYGTFGVLMLTVGGLLGGFVAARQGLKYWLWWMVAAINLPNAVYLLLVMWQPESLTWITLAVALEQFGYGFGFTAYMLYCLYISRGPHETVHYALCTAFMAAGMMLPGAVSGWLQEVVGYERFFVWIMISTIPSFLVTALIPLDAEFGKRTE